MTKGKRFIAILVSTSLLATATAHAHDFRQRPLAGFLSGSSMSLLQNQFISEMPDTLLEGSATETAVTTLKTTKAPQVPMNPQAATFVAEYLKRNNEGLQKVEQRSAPYFKIIEAIFAKYEIPVELKYLAVVESDLIRTAVSRVGAAGPWQLMPGTARELGLRVSKKNDERKTYHKSTVAAAKYLRDLYRQYEDWLLVIAAYNAGPGVINKAIKRSGSSNFWKLQGFLPAETRGHVKRFIGTHYYFEEAGSETTLTKAETKQYEKALERFEARMREKEEATQTDTTPDKPTNEQEATAVAAIPGK
jgi:membrane-bound lytic murein transglycosylase D